MSKKKPISREECPSTSFEESLEGLEKAVAELESGKLGLSEALTRYEEGVRYLKSCQRLLRMAERKIELLSGVDTDGNPITERFAEGDADSFEVEGSSRSTRRASDTKTPSGKTVVREDIDVVPRLF